jgi:peroxiredoxin Q/BCP
MLAAGTDAPRFVAKNQDGQEVRLEDFLGQKSVVLYFFPKDNTPG